MADPFASIGEFISHNIIWILIIGGAIFLIYKFMAFRYGRKKFISRAEVERDRRIKDISANPNYIGESVFTNLYHGRKKIGKITHILRATEPATAQDKKTLGNADDKKTFLEIVFRPPSFWNFIMPKKLEILRIYDNDKTVLKIFNTHSIVVLPSVSIDMYFGQHYDLNNAEDNRNAIMNHTYKTDAENLGDIYYAESQKRSTIDLDKAHEITQKQLELQIERERRARAVTGG